MDIISGGGFTKRYTKSHADPTQHTGSSVTVFSTRHDKRQRVAAYMGTC